MAFDDPEIQLAELFELLIHDKFDVVPGPRTRKDSADGEDLRVDFVYEESSGWPLALEATAMPLGELQIAQPDGDHWSRAIQDVVKAENLGSWIVHFGATFHASSLQNEVIDTLRSRKADSYYDSEGRFTLLRNEAATGDAVYFFGAPPQPAQVTGFSRQLLVTAVENAARLRQARPRATHLIVLVGTHHSRDPSLTLVPPSAAMASPLGAIDWIWITFGTDRGGIEGTHPWVWWARPGDSRWETHIGPL